MSDNLPMPDDFLEMMKNKDKIVAMLLKDMDVCKKNEAAFDKMLDAIDGNPDPKKIMKAFAKSNKHLNEMNARLSMLLLVYCAGDNFTSDSAKILVKMGKGEEALKEMFRQKMGGK